MRTSFLLKAMVGSLLGGLIISIITIKGVGFDDIIHRFANASPAMILGYVLISIMIPILLTVKWHVALRAYGVSLPFYSLFIYRLIGFAVAYVTPMSHVGGEPVRALLVGRQGIPMKVSFSAVIVDKSLEMIFNAGLFFIGALIVLNSTIFPIAARTTIFVISVIAVAIVSIFMYHALLPRESIVPFLNKLGFSKLKNWKSTTKDIKEMELLVKHFYSKKKMAFALSILINFTLWIMMFLEYKYALLILGYDPSLFGVFLFLTGVGIAYSIPIPAALGVLELGQISASRLLGLKDVIGAALAFLIRVRDIFWTVIGLVLLGLFHYNFFKLYEKSQEAAKKFNFRTLHSEIRELYEEK